MKMKRKIIGTLVCMLVLLPVLSITATAEGEPDIQIGRIRAINRLLFRKMPTVLIGIINEGEANASDVIVSINVKHRLFRILDFTFNDTIELIPRRWTSIYTF